MGFPTAVILYYYYYYYYYLLQQTNQAEQHYYINLFKRPIGAIAVDLYTRYLSLANTLF